MFADLDSAAAEPSATPLRTRPRRRRRRRAETRKALLDAALALMRDGEPVTTVSITRQAGIAQPGFYVHFANVEECQRVVLSEVAVRLVKVHAAQRRRLLQAAPFDLDSMTVHFEQTLQDHVDSRDWFQVMKRYHGDPSPLGAEIALHARLAREELADDLWALAARLGVDAARQDEITVLAEFMIAATTAGAEALISGRRTDVRQVARALAITAISTFRGALEACGVTVPN